MEKLQNVKGKQTEVQKESANHMSECWYLNFPMLVKAQGGQIDKERATVAATNIARKAAQKGPPYIVWNSWSEELEYLDIKKGIRKVYTEEKTREIAGEFEVDPAALQEAQNRGLSNDIPQAALNHLKDDTPPT